MYTIGDSRHKEQPPLTNSDNLNGGPTASAIQAPLLPPQIPDEAVQLDSRMKMIEGLPLEKKLEPLRQLARTLPTLTAEKTVPQRLNEVFERATLFAVKAVSPREVIDMVNQQHAAFGNHNVGMRGTTKLIPTQRDLKRFHASPQKKVFDFLLSQIKTPRNETAWWVSLAANKAKFRRRVKFSTASPAEINRRIDLAPVWAEMVSHAACLKPSRQLQFVKGLEECFEHLPTRGAEGGTSTHDRSTIRSQDAITQAYAVALRNLAAVVPDLIDPDHPDSMSQCQLEAFRLLNNLVDNLTTEQKASVLKAATDALEKSGTHPVSSELRSLCARALPIQSVW